MFTGIKSTGPGSKMSSIADMVQDVPIIKDIYKLYNKIQFINL